jgi:hypothetical protein
MDEHMGNPDPNTRGNSDVIEMVVKLLSEKGVE